VIKKTTAYGIVTFGITFTYVLVVVAFEFLTRHFWGYYSFWASVPAAFVIAITFVPVRGYLQKTTDTIFFRRMIEYQNIIKEVTRLIVSVTDLNTLFRLIDRTIVRAMCVKNVAILLLEEGQNHYLVEKTNGLPPEVLSIRLSLDSPLASYLKERKDAVVYDEMKALIESDLVTSQEKSKLNKACSELESLGAIAAIPSFTKDKLVGILCLGEKLSGEPYSPDDLELMLTMASEAGIAIENAKLYRDISETRDYLNSIVEGSDDAIITMDLSGRVLTWNEGAKTIFECSPSEAIGKIPPFFTEEELKPLINKVLQAEEVKAIELRKMNKADKEIPLLLTLSPIRSPEGRIIGISAILKDITELRKVDQLKQEFLAVVSHELRTPLTPIKGYLSLLLEGRIGKLEPKQKDALNVILSQSNHLHDLIDSVIDISRIESGRPLELQKEPLFIEDIIKESIDASAIAVKSKQINLMSDFPLTRSAAMADRQKVLRLMDNLLGNAIKFTPPSGSIKVSVEKEDHNIKVSVTDTGIGIEPEELEKVFKSFYQVDTSYTRACGGIGMGLSIAREIVEAHGGRIWAESEGRGKGSTFVFLLLPGK
ncbi:MAG: ATP-binding protein, partial [Candidatus Margulisiibacteriota bacterium]